MYPLGMYPLELKVQGMLCLHNQIFKLCERLPAKLAFHVACERLAELEDKVLEEEERFSHEGTNGSMVCSIDKQQEANSAIQLHESSTAGLRQAKLVMDQAVQHLAAVAVTSTSTTACMPLGGTISWLPPADGICLVELFAGLASGLEACLQAGINVKRYVYVDNDPAARMVANSRLAQLHEKFSQQLKLEAMHSSFTDWPQDINLIQEAHVAAIGQVDLGISGWECQGFSMAGHGKGLQHPKTALFHELLRVLYLIKHASPQMGYVLENSPAQLASQPEVQHDFALVQHFLGRPI